MTPKEETVRDMLEIGYSEQEIAEIMDVGIKTIALYRNRLKKRPSLRNPVKQTKVKRGDTIIREGIYYNVKRVVKGKIHAEKIPMDRMEQKKVQAVEISEKKFLNGTSGYRKYIQAPVKTYTLSEEERSRYFGERN